MEELQNNVKLLLARMDKLEQIDTNVRKIDARLTSLTQHLANEVKSANNRIDDIEKSQKFISEQFDKNEKKVNFMITKEQARENEYKNMVGKVNNLESQLESERLARNISEQFDRSSFQIKILNVPEQDGESELVPGSNPDTENVIKKIAKAAGIKDFNLSQIDICHRIPVRNPEISHAHPSIIARFVKKSDRLKFFAQRNLLYNIEVVKDAVDEKGAGVEFKRKERDEEVTFRSSDTRPVMMVEALTQLNADLLDMARKTAKPLGYKYIGYTVNGQVRVKKMKDGKYIPIRCKDDIKHIV